MDWVERVCRVRQWTRDGKRAPHKPLLLLYALGHFQREGDKAIRYREAEEQLELLLQEFGKPHDSHMAYPFHFLRNDGFWNVTWNGTKPSPKALRDADAEGRFSPELVKALREDATLLPRMARAILETNFPPSLHDDICQVAGLRLDSVPGQWGEVTLPGPMAVRDPAFRERVLIAYEYCCAFCGFDGMLGRTPVGIEAAHVRWWSEGGPDEVANGLALCSLHHKLLDLGVLGIGPDHTVVVSDRFVGRSDAARAVVHALEGRAIARPQGGHPVVAAEHAAWHRREVFKGQARGAV